MATKIFVSTARRALSPAWLGLEPDGIHFAEESWDIHGPSGRGRGFFLFQEEAGATERHADLDQQGAEPGPDPAGERRAVVRLGGSSTGCLFQGGGE